MAKVLIVDDREDDRVLLSLQLTEAGHEVIEAPDGWEALRLARAERPDIVISDVRMPNMTGYELARRLHEDPEMDGIPVVFSTSTYKLSDIEDLASAAGVDHLLAKPIDKDAVVATIAELLGEGPPARP